MLKSSPRWIRTLALGLAVLGLVAVSGCGQEEKDALRQAATPAAFYQAELYDKAVDCAAYGYYCYDQGSLAHGEAVADVVSIETSVVFGAAGLLARMPVRRSDGRTGELVLDIPLTAPSTNIGRASLSYEERDAQGAVLFAGERVNGKLEIAEAACPCQDIRFELTFTDAGPDQILGTADDLVRRFNSGLFGRHGTACRTALTLPVDEMLGVIELQCSTGGGGGGTGSGTGTGTGGGGGGGGGGGSGGGGGGSSGYDTAVAISEGCSEACNSTDGCASSDEGCDTSESNGCQDSGSCDGDGSSGGCEGDSSSGGCEGGGGGGCGGGSDPACAVARRLGGLRLHNGSLMITMLLLLAFRQTWRWRRRRARRRGLDASVIVVHALPHDPTDIQRYDGPSDEPSA